MRVCVGLLCTRVCISAVCVCLCLCECVWQGYWNSVRMWECQLLFPVPSLTQFTGLGGFVLVSRVNLTKLFKGGLTRESERDNACADSMMNAGFLSLTEVDLPTR